MLLLPTTANGYGGLLSAYATHRKQALTVAVPIERASVEVQGGKERFLLVDVGERSLLLEPRPGERLSLKLRYRGPSPVQAAFWLVSHPTH